MPMVGAPSPRVGFPVNAECDDECHPIEGYAGERPGFLTAVAE